MDSFSSAGSLQLPATLPFQDPVLGNGNVQIKGALTVDASGRLDATVTSVGLTAQKVVTAFSVTGALHFSGNINSIQNGTGDLDVNGTVDGVNLQFADGSYVRATGLGVHVDSATLFDPVGSVSDDFASNDTIRLDLPTRLGELFEFDAGAGNDTVMLAGGGGDLHLAAGAGNDTVTVLSDHHQIDGGAGNDTVVYTGARAGYTVTKTATGFDVASAGGVDHLANVERLEFRGGAVSESVSFDIAGNAGQAYRIYQAAFNRTPDSKGLGYWIGQMDKGASLKDIAAGFVNSAEFATLYGANPTDEAFVTRLYDNVLHRAYDKGGFDYWVGTLQHGMSRAEVLANFGESPENQAQVIGSIENGITFAPY